METSADWGAQIFPADQYSEIRITGAIGDWVGVSVRGKVVPEQGYWLAIKSDGTYLYSLASRTFHCWSRMRLSGLRATRCDSQCGPSHRIRLA
jgi:hypothetical protein